MPDQPTPIDHSTEPVPICRHCGRAIWRHIYPDGGEPIWRHFTGYMLCQPDEDAPNFTGEEVAEPSYEETP